MCCTCDSSASTRFTRGRHRQAAAGGGVPAAAAAAGEGPGPRVMGRISSGFAWCGAPCHLPGFSTVAWPPFHTLPHGKLGARPDQHFHQGTWLEGIPAQHGQSNAAESTVDIAVSMFHARAITDHRISLPPFLRDKKEETGQEYRELVRQTVLEAGARVPNACAERGRERLSQDAVNGTHADRRGICETLANRWGC